MTLREMSASLAVLVAGCAHAPRGAFGQEAIAELMQLDRAGGAALARRDAAGALAAIADDVVYSGPRGAALDRDGLAASWRPFLSADGPLAGWAPDRAGVAASGDLGWSAGRTRVERKDAQGRAAVSTSEYLTAWWKGAAGWRTVLDVAASRPAAELGPGERREIRAFRSAAGDLEAAMGLWRRTGGEGPRAGGYLTVRRRAAGGAWEVIEDRISPLAGEAPPGELVLLDAAWASSLARGDADGWRALVAEDALVAGRTLRRGREEIWGAWKAFFAEGGPSLRWTPQAGGAAGSGDLAWTTGRSRLERRGPDGKPTGSDGRYLTVWARDAAGAWHVTLDGPLEPPEPLGTVERAAVRTLTSRDGTLEAAIGTWGGPGGPGRRQGGWLTVREKVGGEWKTRLDSAFEFPPPG